MRGGAALATGGLWENEGPDFEIVIEIQATLHSATQIPSRTVALLPNNKDMVIPWTLP